MQYVSFNMADWGSGIDALSAESAIPDTYSEDLLNVDPTPEGYLAKRPGYASKAGWLPVRALRLDGRAGTPDMHFFYLDSGIDVTTVDLTTSRSTPLLISGKVGTNPGGGDFSSADSVQYYTGFTPDTRVEFVAGMNTLSLLGTEHGKGPLLFLGASESLSATTNDNGVIWPDTWSVDKTTADVSVSYTAGFGAFQGFIYTLSGASSAGKVYVDASAGPLTTISIPAATHQLTNFNILTAFYQDTGSAYVQVKPDFVSISATGDVLASFSSAQTNLVSVLRAASIGNIVVDTVAPGTTFTKSFEVTSSFLICAAYEENLLTGEKTTAYPDSIAVTGNVATVSYMNMSPNALNFILYYDYGTLTTNKLGVVANNQDVVSFSTSDVQLNIYGLSHGEIYSSQVSDTHAGWVNHIDNYRAEGRENLVAGLGGNIFVDSDTALPSQIFYPRIRSRISATTIIGPAFASTSNRTRGYFSFTGASEGYAKGTAAVWDSGVSLTKFTLATPGLVTNGMANTILKSTLTDPGIEDYIEISQAAFPQHEGMWRIAKLAIASDTITIWADIPNIVNEDYDETDSGMIAGVFTDTLPLSGTNPFFPEDRLASDLFSDANPYTVLDVTSSVITISGVNEEKSVPTGLRISGSRISRVLPLRDSADAPSVFGLVRGDVLQYSEISRTPQIVRINTLPDTTVNITGDGLRATVSLVGQETSGLAENQTIILTAAGLYTGEHLIESILNLTSFTVSSELTGAMGGILVGNTVEVNESLEFSDSVLSANYLSVPSRWVSVESPEDNFDLSPSTTKRYLDNASFTTQPILRSAMANDTMFFTNGQDEVLKYDGANIYRAGLPSWQLNLFTTVDNTTNSIIVNLPTILPTDILSYANSVYKVTLGEEQKFVSGDIVQVSDGSSTPIQATIISVGTDGTAGLLQMSSSSALIFAAATTTISLVGRYRYYMRLNMIDANSNIIASAIVGSEDNVVDVTESCQISLRLAGLPAFGAYDFNRIEAEIYRTALNTFAPFYRLATIPLSFNKNDAYVDFTDTFSDDTLTTLDAVSTGLEGKELGNSWSQPIRAQYVTSAGGRLVLGNVKAYPKLNLRLVDTGLPISVANLVGKIFTVRKDNEDSGNVTDNTDVMRYQFVNTDSAASVGSFSTGLLTVTAAGTYVAGNWVYLFRNDTASFSLRAAGWHQVVTGGTGSFTIQTGLTSFPAGTDINRIAHASDKRDVPVHLGYEGNFGQKDHNLFTSTYVLLNSLRRLSSAINCSQRVCITAGFSAWMSAQSGGEFPAGEIIINQPFSSTSILEVQLPSFTEFLIFGNGVRRNSGASVSALTELFPSRVVVSYPNFPELFNRPTSSSATSQVYDVNPADGQIVTGIIPFFGDSVFGASAKGSIVVVFKTNSIYLLDLSGNSIDSSRVQKVDSRGIGCTAPFSIAPTQNGIMFATDSGMYRLKQDLTVEYIGRKMERIWQRKTNLSSDARANMTGHYFPTGNQYKLSVPTDKKNNSVYVYNTVREYTADGYRAGSWTTYDNFPATGWANNTSNAFFATSAGDVMQILTRSAERPFRDAGKAISATATLRALDFGEPSIRKAVGAAIINFRTTDLSPDAGTEIYSSIDLKNQFVPADQAYIRNRDTEEDGLGSTGDVKARPIKYTFNRRKGVYFQLQIRNTLLDSPMDVTGISLRVAGLSDAGIAEAKQTKG